MQRLPVIIKKISRKTITVVISLVIICAFLVGYNIMSAQAATVTVDVLNGDGDFETAYANWGTFNSGTSNWAFANSNAQFRGALSALQAFTGNSSSTRTAIGGFNHTFTTPAAVGSAQLTGYWFKTTGSTTRTTKWDIKWEVRNSGDTATIASGTIDITEPVSSGWTSFTTAVNGLSPNTAYILKLIGDSAQNSGGTSVNNVYWDDVVLNVSYPDNAPALPVMSAPADTSNQKGTITLQATAIDDFGVSAVDFEYADNTGFAGATTLTGAIRTAGTAINGTWSKSWDTSALNGTYYVRAKATDTLSQSTTGTYYTYYIDNTAPSAATTTGPADDSYTEGTITLTANAQDNTGVTSLDFSYANNSSFTGATTVSGAVRTSGTAADGTWSKSGFDTTPLTDGTWYFRATAADGWGNTYTGPYNTVAIDNNNPIAAAVTAPANSSTVTGTIDLTASAQDAVRVESVTFEYDDNTGFTSPTSLAGATMYSGLVTNGSWRYSNFDTTGVPDGTLYIRAKATDAVGNNYTGNYITVTVHNDPPTAAAMTVPADNADISGTVTFTANAEDLIGVGSVEFEYAPDAGFTGPVVITGVTRTGGTAQNGTWTKNVDTTAMGDGNFYIRAKVTDLAGKVLRGSAVNVDVDNFPPSFAVQYYTDSGLTQPLNTLGGKPVTKDQTVYVKVIPNEGLVSPPTLNIDAPGTSNDRSGVSAPLTGGSYVYVWNVVADVDGDAAVRVTGTDNFAKTSTDAVPTAGGTVNIDTYIPVPGLTAQKGVGRTFLTWNTLSDHQRYYIYRSTQDGFTPDDGVNKIVEVAAPASSYTDLIGQGAYFYRIKVIDVAGNMSGYSTQVAAISLGATVNMVAYWDDTGGDSTVFWANDVTASGAQLDWTPGTVFGQGTQNAYTVVNNANMYENYYFKVVQPGQTRIIKGFPSSTSTGEGNWIDTGFAHGNFIQDTELCAACHVTHSGLKEDLLKESTYYDLCLFCHGTASSQSKYDVQSGKVLTTDGWKDSLAGPIGSDYGVSKHNVDDRGDVASTVYGSAPGKILTFTCMSCHKPHAGDDDNYRMLRETIYPSDDRFTSTTVSFIAYAIVKDAAVGEEVYMISGSSEFCAACHLDYVKGSAMEAGGTYASFFKHPVTVGGKVYSVYNTSPYKNLYPEPGDNLPLQSYPAGDSPGADKRTAVVCLTCHYAHGSTKAFNVGYPMPNGTPRVFVKDQKMLRLDNYGVCESCHQK